jgi:hypothetical protein
MPALAEEEVVAAEAEAEALAEVVAEVVAAREWREAVVAEGLAVHLVLVVPAHRSRAHPAVFRVRRGAPTVLQRFRRGPPRVAVDGRVRFPVVLNSAAVPASALALGSEPAPVSQLVLVNCPPAAPAAQAAPGSLLAPVLAAGRELAGQVALANAPASQRSRRSAPAQRSAPA